MADFPYIPTRILGSPKDDAIYYIFQSPAKSSPTSDLLLLNATKALDAANLPFTTLSSSPPFLLASPQSAYTPSIGDDGTILVYTGDCRSASQGSTLWKYETDNATSGTNGTWSQVNLSVSETTINTKLRGANYLASGIAYSSTVSTTSELYIFGGMCPNKTTLDSTEWTSSAEYSNAMLTFEPKDASSPVIGYRAGISSSKGPPIAEAGFTITGLQPTVLQSPNANRSQQRNQNFVLIGGHTPTAFINMSQVALFSLPEQSWSFLPVDQPASSPRTDLSARAATTVDPRSGHTAVLTSDGRQIVVFGGWVGDVTTSANPQLAILELGEGYGGDGGWQWSIPDQSKTTPVADSGLYGHGAVMLPGNVMMITGGYSTSDSNTKVKRANPVPNRKTYFFNSTSGTWTTTYTHPQTIDSRARQSSSSGDYMTASKRAGLGAGLTFGIIALLIIVIVYFWYSRRLKRRREAYEEELRGLAIIAHRARSSMIADGDSGQGMTSRNSHLLTGESSSRRNNHKTGAERTGLLFEIPSPTRGLRRSLHSRGAYQPAPRYDDGRLARGSGNIHPIDERDEYDEDMTEKDPSATLGTSPPKDRGILYSAPALDPFLDPDGSRTPSPQSPAREREREVQKWVSDWAAADALMHHHADRLSPDKTDRTSSTLSDQSVRSAVSAQSWQHSAGTMSRSMSQRSAALFSTRPIDVSNHAMDPQRTQSLTQSPSSRNERSQSLTLLSNPRRMNTTDTYTTATTSFSQLQSEGEALLGGYSDRTSTSPTRTQSRARNWMGSVRRVFTGTDRSNSASPENGELSTSSSPTKYHHTEAGVPRRAASTGTMLWQKRQGAKDWDVEGGTNGRTEGDTNDQGAEDEEWDVESAVERRVVQVMFTVPKEKLRVVNRGPDGDGVSMVSRESSVKDTATVKDEKGKGKAKEQEKD